MVECTRRPNAPRIAMNPRIFISCWDDLYFELSPSRFWISETGWSLWDDPEWVKARRLGLI